MQLFSRYGLDSADLIFMCKCFFLSNTTSSCNGVKKLPEFYSPLFLEGRLAQCLASWTMDQGVPGSRPGHGTVCCGLEQVTFTHCLVLFKPRKPWKDDSD